MLQEYLDQLFDAFKEGICISDVEGTVVHLNRRHAEITGIPREEMLGHSVMEFVKRGRLDVVLNPEVMRTGQPATRVQTVSDGRKRSSKPIRFSTRRASWCCASPSSAT